MNDQELEDVLKRYRPAGPPSRLRSRLVEPLRARRTWPWATAAAVLLISIITLRIGTHSQAAGVDLQLGPDATDLAVEKLSHILGDATDARALAEWMVIEDQLRVQAAPVPIDEVSGDRP
jgi:hypothetical protein